MLGFIYENTGISSWKFQELSLTDLELFKIYVKMTEDQIFLIALYIFFKAWLSQITNRLSIRPLIVI